MKSPPRNIAIDWLETIWRTDLNHHCKYLACYLRSFMNAKNDMAWPSYSRMIAETGLSRQTISRYLTELESEGWLVINRGHTGKNSTYTACFPKDMGSSYGELGSSSQDGGSLSQDKGSSSQEHELNKELNNELNNIIPPRKRAIKSTIPDDFVLTDDLKSLALAYWNKKGAFGLILEDEFFKFTNNHKAKGTRFEDWGAAWQTWYCNAVTYYKPTGGNHGQPKQPPIDNSAAGRVRANIARERAAEAEQRFNPNRMADDVVDVWPQVD